MKAATGKKSSSLKGTLTVAGDKSISHRSLILASQAIGTSRISGLLESEDVIHTAEALKLLGVDIEKKKNEYIVSGVGTGGLSEPTDILYMGNSGTGCRLMMGLVSTHNFTSFFNGDASLRKRPMARVTVPLEKFGTEFKSRGKGLLPLAVIGARNPIPISYTLPVASAQVKSAILLAALNSPGKTVVIEKEATRDHTELMMKNFGVKINSEKNKKGEITIEMYGEPELNAQDIEVPGDPSSAAFLVVAALITEGSDITIKNVCMNENRTGLFTTLLEMGAKIEFLNQRKNAGEKIADIRARSSKLKGVKVPEGRAPSMIDEYLILSVAAAFASGKTEMQGLEELKVKESNRFDAIVEGLTECGVKVESDDESITVYGKENQTGGGFIKTHMDHRIAMSFLIFGLAAKNPVTVDDTKMIATSFPNFFELMKKIGASIIFEDGKIKKFSKR